jgi:Holliday junction resolvase RusA-like endonuclease
MSGVKTAYSVFVPGVPKAQPRPRMTRAGHAYNPETAKAWKRAIQAVFIPLRKETIDGPVHLEVFFLMPIPKSMKKTDEFIPHTKKPDTDNLLKAVMDALTDIRIWRDDSVVFSISVRKRYAEVSGARIIISTGFSLPDGEKK